MSIVSFSDHCTGRVVWKHTTRSTVTIVVVVNYHSKYARNDTGMQFQ